MSDEQQQYSHDIVRQQIDGVNIGGPPIGHIQSTKSKQEFFNQIQEAVDDACDKEDEGSLCAAVAVGQIAEQEPFSCMIQLVDEYMNCNEDIPKEKRDAAYKAFTDVTGYNHADLKKIANEFNTENIDLVNLNAFYLFVPLIILIIVMIWVMVGFGWFNWAAGLFFTVLAFAILYSFNIAYRIHANNLLENRKKALDKIASETQSNFENSLAYWPQGFFAAACAITCEDGDNCWTCNEIDPCPPSGTSAKRSCRTSRCGNIAYQEDEIDNQQENIQIRQINKKKTQRFRRK